MEIEIADVGNNVFVEKSLLIARLNKDVYKTNL